MARFRLPCMVLVVASCGFPRPPDVPDPTMDDTSCQLTAIAPEIANTGDTITLEGTFGDTGVVNFPGGASVAATILGPHRMRAVVPATATAGDLTISTCDSMVGPVRFRRASFALGVGLFATTHDQAVGARQLVTLANSRSSHASLVIGGYLYVLGGVSGNGSLNSVERALINADGSLGRFVAVPGVTLAIPRQGHTAVRIRDRLYVIGGFGNGSLASIEYATIAQDGSLGPFTMLSDVGLMTARRNHSSAVIGSYLYVIGGIATNPLSIVERAVIHGDGSLGPFAPVPGVSLATARQGHGSAVIGDFLYVVGGAGNGGILQDIERASINADGSLGPFAAVSGVSLVTARADGAAAVLGNGFYVFGGVGSRGSLDTIERAPVKSDGSLGAFETVSSLVSARHGHSITAVWNYLYVLGGSDDIGLVSHAERATLNASGKLGTFATVPGITLTMEHGDAPGVVTGNFFYVFGDILAGNGDRTAVERAAINADGSLEPFGAAPGIALVLPRDGYATAVIGPYLYLLGGGTTSIERSVINSDGTLGPFEVVTSSSLVKSRQDFTACMIGGYLYVFGGASGANAGMGNIERALINTDGSLGPFFAFADSTVAARDDHATVVIGNALYLMGGVDEINGGFATTVAQAQLNVNGALGAFETLAGSNLGPIVPTIVTVGDSLYALGDDTSVEDAGIIASGLPALGAFAVVPEVAFVPPRIADGVAAIGNYVYAVGGISGRVTLTDVIRAELK